MREDKKIDICKIDAKKCKKFGFSKKNLEKILMYEDKKSDSK